MANDRHRRLNTTHQTDQGHTMKNLKNYVIRAVVTAVVSVVIQRAVHALLDARLENKE